MASQSKHRYTGIPLETSFPHSFAQLLGGWSAQLAAWEGRHDGKKNEVNSRRSHCFLDVVPHLLVCVVQSLDVMFPFILFVCCGWMLFSWGQQSKSGILGDGLSPLCTCASCLVDKRSVLVFLAGVTTAPFERGRRSTWVLQNHTGWGDRCKRQRNHGVPCERKWWLHHVQCAADFEMRFRRILREAAPIFVVRVWFTWCLILLHGSCIVLCGIILGMNNADLTAVEHVFF